MSQNEKLLKELLYINEAVNETISCIGNLVGTYSGEGSIGRITQIKDVIRDLVLGDSCPEGETEEYETLNDLVYDILFKDIPVDNKLEELLRLKRCSARGE